MSPSLSVPRRGFLTGAAASCLVAAPPAGRLGSLDEIASAALFLASDDSSFVNGSELFADGGAAQV